MPSDFFTFIGKLLELFQKQILEDPIFFILSSLVLVTAFAVVLQKNLVRAGFTLIGCFCTLALIYFALGAELIAASQILIYAVGITLVVIFAIMLLAGTMDNAEEQKVEYSNNLVKYLKKSFAFLIPVFTFVLMGYSFMGLTSSLTPSPPYPPSRLQGLVDYVANGRAKVGVVPVIERIGEILLSEQLLAFELVSILLLIAFVSAIVLSRRSL